MDLMTPMDHHRQALPSVPRTKGGSLHELIQIEDR